MSDIVRKDSIEELCGHRARALQLYAQAFDTLAAALEAHKRACVGLSHVSGVDHDGLRFIHYGEYHDKKRQEFGAEQRKRVDVDMWRALMINTNLGSLMDAQERKRFEDGLKDPPPIDAETVFATLQRLAQESGTIFRRGLVEAFRRLSPDHRSNDGFSIGPRMVVRRIVEVSSYRDVRGARLYIRVGHYGEQELRDVDRVLHVLDGRAPPEHMQGICQAMRDAVGKANTIEPDDTWQAETDLLRVKFFKNGNGHLWILRDDLREKANRLIAEHFGATLGAGADVASHRRNAA